jgi:lipopolysaccharide/colanic/teichoic acid biosynthesis glycosyltransferase
MNTAYLTLYARIPAWKRWMDVALVLLLAPLWLPVAAAVALLVRVRLGGPVLFSQPRPGLGGKIFTLRKFRTMTDARDASGAPLPDAARLTRFGRILRATSLDELPELWNVLTGDMSLVGPRPLLPEYLPLYSPVQARRHEVLPGITGWAQVNGRNAITWPEVFNLDVWYVDNMNPLLDLTILARTVGAVFSRRGVSEPGAATRSPFTGNP